MGVLAIIPLVAFFGFGVLDKDDFNGFLWNVVMLAMGGLALGDAVQSSGLLLTISKVRASPPPPPRGALAAARRAVELFYPLAASLCRAACR
jgi:di/tricarboxylate transporter